MIRQPFVVLFGLLAGIGTAQASNSMEAALYGDQPALLAAEVERYAEIVEQGGWQVLPESPELVPGVRHAGVRLLRRQLRSTGDYTAEMGADPLLFDAGLAEAVERYQRRHALAPSGRVDRVTRNYLNVPAQQRLAQLRHARTRWTEAPRRRDERQVIVNIPEALLFGLEPDDTYFSVNVIVGYPDRQTPELSSELRRIVVHPRWTVPRSIATRDLLPRQQQEADYFARNRIRVYGGWESDAPELDPSSVDWSAVDAGNFSYVLRQDPGPMNSLGFYKFEFANPYAVYLHDTPGRDLLQLSYRTLSSGCVHVDEPEALAAWLAGEPFGNALRAAEALPADTSSYVSVAGPVALDIVYLSAWVDPQTGELQMRHDVYGRAAESG